MNVNPRFIERLQELGLVHADRQGRAAHFPFNGTLSPDEKRLMDQKAFQGPVVLFYSARDPRAK